MRKKNYYLKLYVSDTDSTIMLGFEKVTKKACLEFDKEFMTGFTKITDGVEITFVDFCEVEYKCDTEELNFKNRDGYTTYMLDEVSKSMANKLTNVYN